MTEPFKGRVLASKMYIGPEIELKEIHHEKPCNNFDIEKLALNFNITNLADNAQELLESKNITETVDAIFPPHYAESMEAQPARQLELQKRILRGTEVKLKMAREKLASLRANVAKEWKDLEVKEAQLKKNFIEFDQFVRENGEKRARAKKKIAEDLKMIQKREARIEVFKEEIEKMREVQRSMEKQIKHSQPHRLFLQEVARVTGHTSIMPIIRRYQSLQVAKEILSKRQENTLETLENAKTTMMKLIEEKNLVIMGLNNQIANLQARYENANIKALESEALVTQIKNNAVKQLGEIDTVKNSIWNVYVHMALSKKHPIKIKKNDVEQQMMYINRTLTELTKINKLIKKKAKQTIKY